MSYWNVYHFNILTYENNCYMFLEKSYLYKTRFEGAYVLIRSCASSVL